MGRADDMMSSFLAAYPHAMSGELSMEELNELMAKHQEKVNNEGVPYIWPLKQYILDEGIVKKRN